MRTIFYIAALALGVSSAACGAAPVSWEEATKDEATDDTKAESQPEGLTSMDCRAWATCHRICLHNDPKGKTDCDDKCDARYPQCDTL